MNDPHNPHKALIAGQYKTLRLLSLETQEIASPPWWQPALLGAVLFGGAAVFAAEVLDMLGR